MTRQYQRHVKITFNSPFGATRAIDAGPIIISSYAGNGPRIAFTASRNNRGEPDRCTLQIYNLPEKIQRRIAELARSLREDRIRIQSDYRRPRRQRPGRQDVMKKTTEDEQEIVRLPSSEKARRLQEATRAYAVNVFTGYGPHDKDLTLMFRGDLVDVSPSSRRGGVDTITKIELGDTLFALRDSYTRRAHVANAPVFDIVRAAVADAGLILDAESGENFVRQVLPNVVTTRVKNRLYAVGRPADVIQEWIDLFGAQWWVSDGKLYIGAQGFPIDDFFLSLKEGRDLLDFSQPQGYGDYKGLALLNANIVPGRGLLLIDADGKRLSEYGFRVSVTRMRADTRGPEWYTEFEAENSEERITATRAEFGSPVFEGGVRVEDIYNGRS